MRIYAIAGKIVYRPLLPNLTACKAKSGIKGISIGKFRKKKRERKEKALYMMIFTCPKQAHE